MNGEVSECFSLDAMSWENRILYKCGGYNQFFNKQMLASIGKVCLIDKLMEVAVVDTIFGIQ